MKVKIAEWVSFSISLLLILAMAGHLVYDISREQDESAQIRTEVLPEKKKTSDGLWVATVLVHNHGRKAATHVKVKAGELEFELDYVPGKATETWKVVGTESDLKDLRALPVSYSEK